MVRTGPFSTLVLFVSSVGIYVGAAWWLARWGWMLPLVVPVGTMGLGGSLAGFQCWRREQVFREALEDLEKAKQNFTDMLVHDMKNQVQPLTISLELLQAAELDCADDSTTRQRLARGVAKCREIARSVGSVANHSTNSRSNLSCAAW